MYVSVPSIGATEFLGLTHPSERSLTNNVLSPLRITAIGIGEQRAVLFRQEEAWSNGIHTDAFAKLARTLSSHVLRKIGDTRFGQSITANTRQRTESCHQGEIDESPFRQ